MCYYVHFILPIGYNVYEVPVASIFKVQDF